MPTDVINDAIVSAIVKKWGLDAQIDVAIEELAELTIELATIRGHSDVLLRANSIKKLMKASRKSTIATTIQIPLERDTKSKLAEEVADVHIMIEQIIRVFDLWAWFNKYHDEKRDRLCKRLSSHE